MNTATINISEDFSEALERYTHATAQLLQKEVTHKDLEEARSYAVQCLDRLLNDNPDTFPYRGTIDAIIKRSRHS